MAPTMRIRIGCSGGRLRYIFAYTQEEYAAFDWSNLSEPTAEWLTLLPDTAAMYHDPYTGLDYPLSNDVLNMVQACSLTVWDDPLVISDYQGEDLIYFSDSAGGFTQMSHGGVC